MRHPHFAVRLARPAVVSLRVVLFVSSLSLLSALPAAAAIRGQVEGQHLRIFGADPSGTVVVVAAIRETSNTHPVSLDRVVRTLTGDAAGDADFDYGRAIPVASIWAVVDQSSGSYAIVTPGDYPRREKPFTGSILKHATPGEAIDQLT